MPGGSGRETPAGGRGPLRRGCAMVTRRQLLKAGAVGGAGLLVPWEAVGRAWAAIPGGSLDPTTIHKYAAPLVIPPVMPPLTGPRSQSVDRYAIAVRQFRQQILPPGMPATTVWGYGSAPHRGTFNYPAFTIEARDLPHASNIPAGYAEVGSFYDEFRAKFQGKWHQAWPPGTAVFQYQNDQRAATLWFHDHTLGMTRVNVYAGPAGFYLL